MTESVPTKKDEQERKRPWWILLLLLFLAVGTCSFFQHWGSGNGKGNGGDDASRRRDSLARVDSLARHRQDSLDALARRRNDSLGLARQRHLDSLAGIHSHRGARHHRKHGGGRHGRASGADDSLAKRLDSLRLSARADSLRRIDSARVADSLSALARAATDLYVVADPAGGVHPAPVDVAVMTLRMSVTPLCALDDSTRLTECRNLVRIDRDRTLWISAVDSAGRHAPLQKLVYRIDPDASRCGPHRVLVPVSDTHSVCVDAYEYPNDPHQIPRTSVSWQEASALCGRLGKHLCGRDELQLACQGPQDWKYPYGPEHVTGYCQDGGSDITYGHDHPGCRSWWGAYDMVGNAWEWTSTPYKNAYWVFGGYYGEGPEASCQEVKHSFYPQNRYNAVGFRCCEDAPATH